MKKFKQHFLHSTTVNYDEVQYFYKLERWDYGKLPKFRVFIIDPDDLILEVLFSCMESEIEENIISFCEGQN